MTEGAYRSELDAAHARIAKLEDELARRDLDPTAVRRAALARQREIVAALALPNLTRVQLGVSNATFITFAAMAVGFGLLGLWLFAVLCGSLAIGIRIVFARSAQGRAVTYARRLAAIDEQIAALETSPTSAPAPPEAEVK